MAPASARFLCAKLRPATLPSGNIISAPPVAGARLSARRQTRHSGLGPKVARAPLSPLPAADMVAGAECAANVNYFRGEKLQSAATAELAAPAGNSILSGVSHARARRLLDKRRTLMSNASCRRCASALLRIGRRAARQLCAAIVYKFKFCISLSAANRRQRRRRRRHKATTSSRAPIQWRDKVGGKCDLLTSCGARRQSPPSGSGRVSLAKCRIRRAAHLDKNVRQTNRPPIVCSQGTVTFLSPKRGRAHTLAS